MSLKEVVSFDGMGFALRLNQQFRRYQLGVGFPSVREEDGNTQTTKPIEHNL